MMRHLLFIAITAALVALKTPHPFWYVVTMYALIAICICLFVACDPDPLTQEDIDGYIGPRLGGDQPKGLHLKLI